MPATADGPPVARKDGTTETYFGRTVADPYRWMEERGPEMVAWAKAQDAYARSVLDAIPGRDRLRATMDEVTEHLAKAGGVSMVPGRIFFRRQEAGVELGRLVTRDLETGDERVLFDANAVKEDGIHVALDQYQPSLDGKFVALGYSPGGSEESVLHVVETATGRELPDVIDRAKNFAVGFLPDNSGFFYNRLRAPVAGAAPADRYNDNKVYFHAMGANADEDPVMFGPGVGALKDEPHNWFYAVRSLPGTGYALGSETDGTDQEQVLWVAKLPATPGAPMAWRKVASYDDAVVDAQAGTDTLYLRTHKGASRYRVVAMPLADGDFSHATEVVPEQPGVVLTNIAAAEDALYVGGRKGSASVLWRMTYDGALTAVTLPATGTIEEPLEGPGALVADPRVEGAALGIETWISPQTWYLVRPDGAFKRLGLTPAYTAPGDYDVTETTYKARDGVAVPISIVTRRGTPRDGKRPVLMESYGSYGISETPFAGLLPVAAAWTGAGGVFAVAHVRGGGDLGDDWHRAGQKATKQTTIHDCIDGAKALMDMGYATPETMAITGTSAGGITVGGALTQAPELFRVVIDRVGVSDSLRSEVTENGPSNIPEFGTVTNKDEFGPLYDMDAYQHVTAGVPYPAVLLTAGFNDHRVEWWEPAKMAAALQAAGSARGPVILRIEYEGGHGGIGEGQSQENAEWSDDMAFALNQMGAEGFH